MRIKRFSAHYNAFRGENGCENCASIRIDISSIKLEAGKFILRSTSAILVGQRWLFIPCAGYTKTTSRNRVAAPMRQRGSRVARDAHAGAARRREASPVDHLDRAERLIAESAGGYRPCGAEALVSTKFTRRICVEVDGVDGPLGEAGFDLCGVFDRLER